MDGRPQFEPRFVVGIEQVDREHRQLFEIAGRVHDSLSGDDKAAWSAARTAVVELLNYTATHFVSEEKLMAEADYPELAEHQALHQTMIARARDMELRLDLGDPSVPMELNRFIHRWLVDHIKTNDKKFGQFVAARQ